jgi:hypothetical protein
MMYRSRLIVVVPLGVIWLFTSGGCSSAPSVTPGQEAALHKKLEGPPNARNRGAHKKQKPPTTEPVSATDPAKTPPPQTP